MKTHKQIILLLNDMGGGILNTEKGDVSPTLRSQTHGHEPIILEKETMKTYALAGNIIGRKPQNGGNGGGYREEVAYTMDTIGNFGIAQVEDDMEQQVYDARGNGDGKTANTITGDHANRVTDFTPIVASFMGGQGAKAGGIGYEEKVSSTIKAAPSGGNQVPDIVIGQNSFVDTGHGDYWKKDDAAGTIRSEGESRPSRPSNVICVHGSQDPISNTEHVNAVGRNNGLENCVAIPINSMVIGKDIKEGDRQTTGIGKEGDPCPTLQTKHHHAVASHLSVRRLLPIECERLMGFPDNWTKIPWRGKPADECPDAPPLQGLRQLDGR